MLGKPVPEILLVHVAACLCTLHQQIKTNLEVHFKNEMVQRFHQGTLTFKMAAWLFTHIVFDVVLSLISCKQFIKAGGVKEQPAEGIGLEIEF